MKTIKTMPHKRTDRIVQAIQSRWRDDERAFRRELAKVRLQRLLWLVTRDCRDRSQSARRVSA
jgi:hypothetical protein